MRPKILVSLLLLFVFLAVPLVVYAQGTPQNRAQNQRDAAVQRKEAAQQKREELKTRLQTIKDEKKKAAVERIDTKIANMNEVYTVRFVSILTKLQSVLERVSQKAAEAKANGKDTALADAAIADAQAAIDSAKTAVSAQAAKEYVVSISDEKSLRNSVGATVSQFRKDLRDVHKMVVDAKQAVQNAVKELAKVASASGVNPNSATGGAVAQ
ncbi:MAG: hypothetical protein HYS68_00325 [Candidatus Levybacteria bacterium]|nr:hypothetical protein [Candidatus Levybacteria bacterium]